MLKTENYGNRKKVFQKENYSKTSNPEKSNRISFGFGETRNKQDSFAKQDMEIGEKIHRLNLNPISKLMIWDL